MKPISVAVYLPVALAVAFTFASNSGCTTSCDDAVDGGPEVVTDGITDPSGNVYESSPWDGDYHEFLPQEQLQFQHGLSGRPRSVQVYVGFVPAPLTGKHPNISEAAGNEAIIEHVTEEFVQIRNDTCETFYVRLVASNPIQNPDPNGTAGSSSL